VQISYLCDTSEGAFLRIGTMIPRQCSCVTDIASILENPHVDAVVIATPAATHFALTQAALSAGKHVFCEKPLALDPAECLTLRALALKKNLQLMVGFTFLFNPGIIKVKELIAGGDLGTIYYLTSARTHLGLIRDDVSSLWDLAPHDVSIMNYLLDAMPEKVSAVGATPLQSGREDYGFINLFYPGGIIGQIHVSWLNASKERLLKIVGSKSKVEFDDLNLLEPVRLYQKGIGFAERIEPDFGKFKHLLRDGDIVSPRVEMREPLSQMVDAFVRFVLDNEKTIANADVAYDVSRVLSAVHASMRECGAPMPVG
jgi:predicted dehydrogenase